MAWDPVDAARAQWRRLRIDARDAKVATGAACVGLGLMPQLNIRHGFAFMGTNMRPIQRELGFTIMEGIGDEGQFDYPAPPIRSEIGHFQHPESIADAAEDVQDMARRAAEEPTHEHGVDGRFHRIRYRVENHMA